MKHPIAGQETAFDARAWRAGLAGRWRVTREIADAIGPDGRFDGEAVFSEAPGGLDYVERGVLRLGGAVLQAERRALWRAEGPRVAVFFADGRPFHTFDPAAPRPEARHVCGADVYVVAYDCAFWPHWETVWRVHGPRKDYRMVTRHARPAAP